MAKGYRRKTQQAAAAADLPVSSFIRKAVLEKILRTLGEEELRNDPEMRAHHAEKDRRRQRGLCTACGGKLDPDGGCQPCDENVKAIFGRND
jgi:hypothetical protein